MEIRSLQTALRGAAISPYRWVELAEGYEQNGDAEKARLSFRRAEELAPNLPPVWIRAAAFHFRLGESEEGLRAGARAQAISGASDAFLFQYYERYVADAPLVTGALAADRRSLSAWFRRLQAGGDAEDAATAWGELERRNFTDVPLAASYVAFLLDRRRYEAAREVWLKAAPPGPAGGIVVLPGHRGSKLWPDSAEALLESGGSLPPVAGNPAKRMLAARRACRGPAPLRRIYLLTPAPLGGPAEIAPADASEAVPALVEAAFRIDPGDSGLVARQFRFLMRVAAGAPIRRLRYAHDFGGLPALRERILEEAAL